MYNIHKKTILVCLFAIASFPLFAQVGELRNNFSVGVNAGVNYSNVSFTPKIEQSGLLGFAGGFTARYITEKYFAMICGAQLELNFSQRGWKELIDDGTGNQYNRVMNYLEIPFLAHLAFGKEKGVQFFINLGPQIAFLLNEKENFSNPWNAELRTNYQYNKKAEKKFDYGIVGGLGLELRTKAGNFLIEGRYYFGLSDFYKINNHEFTRSAHTTILGRITYLFDLSK